ncbi:EVE domain-containing protein [Polaribacter vadi]|uniref:EVE domain-containing protein n=1 Tax=Polaribacter TaxID=52959 RepID=UPI001C09A708|nr:MULTISPECIES: EVE domain-containing protein [Polaribacter]MBU3012264.1 EVE domain-containing protein [Polaribacter vadi]MDO6742081.1 EVE domain-containing protein [Polaribacter sp. 1_MG-2023]
MLFEKVTKEHILQGIKDFEENGLPNGFGPSSTYDLVYNGIHYPPKAIMAYANFYAEGRTIKPYFKGGLNTDCFNAFEKLQFSVIKKQLTDPIFQIQVSKTDKTSDGNFLTAKLQIVKGGYQLLKGSYIYKEPKPSFLKHSYYQMRVKYEKEDYFEDSDYSKYVILKKSITFNRPSPAAVITLNRAANGKYEWKLKDGTTLEEFENKQVKPLKQINYWIFQGNPDIYNITNALKYGHLKSWKVAAHKDKIKIGDQIILWQTGNQSGCYALAEVTSEVGVLEEEKIEQQYYLNPSISEAAVRVKIKITKNLVENPILWKDIKEDPKFLNFKAGNQGTNFSATQKEFETLLNWNQNNNTKYWLYSPGGGADHWDEFYNGNIMAIGYDKLGDLRTYKSKDEIRDALISLNGGEGNPMNKVVANYDFLENIKIGDIIIVKKGISKLLGYGVVTSDYFFDSKRESYKSCRKVDWKLKGEWHSEHKLVLKTLTDVTIYDSEYKGYDKYSDYLMELMTSDKKEKIAEKIITDMKPTNQILYGPPGTGKTYYLKDQLFDTYTLRENAITKEKFFEDKITNLTWWQVIAIALIENGTSKVNDILENRWLKTKASLSESKNVRATIWGTLQMHTITSSENVAYKQRQNPLIFDKNNDKMWQLLEEETKEQIPEIYDIIDEVNNFKSNNETVIKNYDFVTFHQSFSYEDFIEGIKPVFPETEEETKDLGYTIEDGVFKKLCTKAKNDSENRYAIFIDEINRGNVSAIFGELITLIEIDKRSGAKNELSIKLPYSKINFSVPSNLDIYGTMNIADRSVEALDTALRRRFEFKEMMPDYAVIENEEVDNIKLSEVLKKINERIELLIDRDHTIGHSYFFNVNSEEKLVNAFNNKIVPLLQEYFYGDYGKIGLVLGKGFVEKKKNDDINFADFSYENSNDFKAPSYLLKLVNEGNVIDAVLSLLGKKQAE